ncbi:MAG: hypothetical protein LBC77_08485 [Spirochaetaceae bacterium]|jgi:hypothetical protein|nr:hypothetical protein [Spirochaetaceae bacterium]
MTLREKLLFKATLINSCAVSRLLCAALCFFASPFIDAQSTAVRSFDLPNARFTALGNFHNAVTDDFASAFYNPAGLASVRSTISAAELTFLVNSVDLAYEIYFGELEGLDFLKLITDRINGSFTLGGPFSIGKISDGFGWHLYNASRFDIFWDRNDIFLIHPSISEEVVVALGYGYRVLEFSEWTMDVGLSAHTFYRLAYSPKEIWIQEVLHILAEIDEERFVTEIGVTFDGGIRWSKDDLLSFALNYKNFFSYAATAEYGGLGNYIDQKTYATGGNNLTPQLSGGFAVRFKSPIMHHWDTDIVFSMDYHGLYTLFEKGGRNKLYDFGAGFELRFLEVVSLRAGWYDMMPAFGLGINFTGLQLDIAIAGRQLDDKLWEKTTYIAAIGIMFNYYPNE